MNIILIDSGTTNSRIRLTRINSNEIIDSIKLNIGVRNTAIEGNNTILKNGLKEGLLKIINRNNLTSQEIEYIIASGMITSNLGIYEVPHIKGPASIKDFASNSVVYKSEEFLNIPIIFIPGMENSVEDENDIIFNINDYDIMRGEEVETIGLLEQINVKGKGIMILPGSHTKYIFVDENKKLLSCLSTLGGETLLSIQKETILSKSLKKDLICTIQKDMLKKGYDAAREYGVTRGLYHVRLLDKFSELDSNYLANYYTGVIIHDDIKSLLKSLNNKEDIDWVIIGGSDPLKNVFYYLIKHLELDWNIIKANDEQVEYSTVIGSKTIASRYMKVKI